ncbi:hypothetical protein JZ00_00945 [Pseudomonas frederiksbergensis]|jgi:hypothetical protein|uniref:Uncharacterized protein n=1 Tax=Pseudomonas frederiksbergensis TaxID=104087 RepID=A0A0B1Z5S2_9PSED|nr:hypothetical protein JZ00_00945 [Pseudomonas frederiksbergensis]
MNKLTIRVKAESASGISSLLDLALTELRRKSQRLVEFDTSMVGSQEGTFGIMSWNMQYRNHHKMP